MAASVRNTAIKRIQGDVREMMKDPSDQYAAAPLEENLFDWHFTLRGPPDTEFEGGIYHGRILLPADYPFKPPNIMLLTPNGRFEVRKKICLSISAFHPEEWQPAWGIRLILEALISFMPTEGEGAIGALDYPKEERRRLAKLSREYKCDVCGKVADLLPELHSTDANEEHQPSKYASQIAQLHLHDVSSKKAASDSGAETIDHSEVTPGTEDAPRVSMKEMPLDNVPNSTHAQDVNIDQQPNAEDAAALQPPHEVIHEVPAPNVPPTHPQHPPDRMDNFLSYITIALSVALCALVYKKLLQMQGLL